MPFPCRHTLPLLLSILLIASTANSQRGGPQRGGPPRNVKREVMSQFDEDKSGWLNRGERDNARAWMKENPSNSGRRGRRGGRGRGPGGRGPGRGRPESGPQRKLDTWNVERQSVKQFPDAKLYAPKTLRTLFIDFEKTDWFEELSAFYRTDIEVPASLTADGVTLGDVGIRFRGNSSYFGIGHSKKKSIGVSIDFIHSEQRLKGYRSLNLLNANDDPSFMREVLYTDIYRDHAPAARCNLVHVVINGESWGVYVNVQQLNKDFMKEQFGSSKGARWKIPAGFSGTGALIYDGDDIETYKKNFQLKTGSAGDAEWKQLINLTKVLCETPVEELPEKLPSVLDVHEALWFLAMDNVFMDSDGYFSRGSDYSLVLDSTGIFHVVTRDNNETFQARRGGPGRRGGRRPGGGRDGPRGDRGGFPGPPDGGGPPDRRMRPDNKAQPRGGRMGGRGGAAAQNLSPLEHIDNESRPLISRLLQVPKWRARYLAHVKYLATEHLNWKHLKEMIDSLDGLVRGLVQVDDKCLYGFDAYLQSISAKQTAKSDPNVLETWVATRRPFLLKHEALKAKAPVIADTTAHAAKASGDLTRLVIEAKISSATRRGVRVSCHVSQKKRGIFLEVPMHDDGKNGDVKASDGVFTASISWESKKTPRYYIEAYSPKQAASSFYPSSTERGALKIKSN